MVRAVPGVPDAPGRAGRRAARRGWRPTTGCASPSMARSRPSTTTSRSGPRPEPLIRRLIAEGRLAIGPWQILMDEFLVSGETIVRNLELGWDRAEAFGAAMRVGYLPDMFGHVAQMPQILRRAGIDTGRRLARRAGRDRPPRVHLARARRLGGRDRVPRRWLRQRGVPVRRPAALESGWTATASRCRLLRRPLAAGDVRHGPRGPVAAPGRPRRRRERRPRRRSKCAWRRSSATSSAGRRRPMPPVCPRRSGPASSGPARAPTCS